MFFRTAFFSHENISESEEASVCISRDEYRNKIIKKTAHFSESFLTIDTLAPELSPKILGAPKYALMLTLLGLGLAILGLLYGPFRDLASVTISKNSSLEKRIEKLEEMAQTQTKKNLPQMIRVQRVKFLRPWIIGSQTVKFVIWSYLNWYTVFIILVPSRYPETNDWLLQFLEVI